MLDYYFGYITWKLKTINNFLAVLPRILVNKSITEYYLTQSIVHNILKKVWFYTIKYLNFRAKNEQFWILDIFGVKIKLSENSESLNFRAKRRKIQCQLFLASKFKKREKKFGAKIQIFRKGTKITFGTKIQIFKKGTYQN